TTDSGSSIISRSVPRVAGRARKRDNVADVRKSGCIRDRALEAETEAGVRHRPVAAQIAVPTVVRDVEADLGDSHVEHVEPLLALAAADDLADAWREHVHRRDGFAIVVDAHVERLDRLR